MLSCAEPTCQSMPTIKNSNNYITLQFPTSSLVNNAEILPLVCIMLHADLILCMHAYNYSMIENKQYVRFRYSMKSQRFRQQRQLIFRELPHRKTYRSDEALYYLALQGYHLDESEFQKISQRLFGKTAGLTAEEMIGIVARLGVEDEVERQLRRVFEFFTGGEDTLTAQDLKNALERLGETLKQKEINQILADMDLNTDGYIDFETFLEAMLIQ